jgi:hypothetical protein
MRLWYAGVFYINLSLDSWLTGRLASWLFASGCAQLCCWTLLCVLLQRVLAEVLPAVLQPALQP